MSEATDKRQFLGMEGVKTLLAGLEGEYSPLEHAHDDLIESIEKITDGTTTVAQATEATHSSTSDEATHAESADHATSADSATKATQDAEGNVITDTYETKEDAETKLAEAKGYTDTAVANLVNAAPATLDTLGELATAFNENKEVVDALDAAITNKVEQTVFDEHVAEMNTKLDDYVLKSDIPTTQDAIDLAVETGLVEPATDNEGTIFTDVDGNIYSI